MIISNFWQTELVPPGSRLNREILIRRVDGQPVAKVDGEEQEQILVDETEFRDWVADHGKHNFCLEPIASDRAYLSFDDEKPQYIVEGAIDM